MTDEIANRNMPPAIAELHELIDFTSWGNALINGTEYIEPDPQHLVRQLLLGVLQASTVDEVLSENGVGKLQQMIPDAPGQGTGPLLVTELYVTSSDFGEGAPCYIIATCHDLDTGEGTKFSTGAQYLQTQFLAMINLGNWPIQCKIKRINRKDRGGRFLLQMYPVD